MNINTNYNYANFKAINVKLNKQSPVIQKYLSTGANELKDIKKAQQSIDGCVATIRTFLNGEIIRKILMNRHPDVAGKNIAEYHSKNFEFFKDEPELFVDIEENPAKFGSNLELYLTDNNRRVRIGENYIPKRDSMARDFNYAFETFFHRYNPINKKGMEEIVANMLDKQPEYIAFVNANKKEKAKEYNELFEEVDSWKNK